MKFQFLIVRVCILLLVTGAVTDASTLLLQDDFSDNTLDAGKWVNHTTYPGGSMSEANGRIELSKRGMLRTRDEFDPQAWGGLRITGELNLAHQNEQMNIVWRYAGQHSGSPFHNAVHGLEFSIIAPLNLIRLVHRKSGKSGTEAFDMFDSRSMSIQSGDRFAFSIIDDGTNILASFEEIGGQQVSATLSASFDGIPGGPTASQYVGFYNREYPGNASYFDEITIEALGEPIPAPLAVLGALAVLPAMTFFKRKFT